jgi:streptogramin lyase/cytochrome c5
MMGSSIGKQRVAMGVIATVGVAAGYMMFGTGGGAVAAQKAPSGAALPGMATVSGTVDAPKPFKAAQVYIRNADTRMQYMVYTNAGAFRAVALLPGNYEIGVQATGLESDYQKVALKAGAHPTVKLSMREAASPDRHPSGSADAPARNVTIQSYDEVYPPGPGKEVIERVCMNCHGENYFPARPASAATWASRLDIMMGKNLYDKDKSGYGDGVLAPPATNFGLGIEDRKNVIAYLAKNFGNDAKPRAVRTDKEIPLDEAKLGKAQFIEYYLPLDQAKGGNDGAPEIQSEGGLPSHRVAYTLQIDGQGNVWAVDRGIPNRLVKLDPRTGEMKDYVLPDPKSGVHEILIDREGIVWVPEFAGVPNTRTYRLLGFNPKTEKWEKMINTDPDNVLRTTVKGGMLGTTLDSKGNIYMNMMLAGAVGRWDRATGKMSIFRIPTPTAVPYGMAIDKNDNVWSAEWNGGKLAKLDTTTHQFTEYATPIYPANMRRGVGVDSKNNVWVGIWAAGNRPAQLVKLDQTTGRMTLYAVPHRGAQPYEMSADLEDNIWFPDTGTADHPAAIGRFNPRDQTFTFYPKPQFVADTSKLQHTTEGAVWYAPRGGAPAGSTGFGVLYPDKDKITSLAAYPLNGPPGYAFKVAPAMTTSSR